MQPPSLAHFGLDVPPIPDTISAAVRAMSEAERDDRGAVFTRREVVEFILDLTGYTADLDLAECRLLEPSFGHGDFLVPAVERLLDSQARRGIVLSPTRLRQAVRGVELHRESCSNTQTALLDVLTTRGMQTADAAALVDHWLRCDDFLLTDLPETFTHVVGNPPYVRQERIPATLMVEYRQRYRTIYDRADLYVPFIERSLASLAPGGVVGFICADRWTKNRYGAKLRKFVADRFHVRQIVDMVDTPAFHSDVIAYPAVFVIARESASETRLAARPDINSGALDALAKSLRSAGSEAPANVRTVSHIAVGDAPWLTEDGPRMRLLRDLEARLPTLGNARCTVGIGVATGADRVYVRPWDDLDVEPDRKLRLATTRDILGGDVRWGGMGVVNPFEVDGSVVDLARYPKLRAYFEAHRAALRGRRVAVDRPLYWYRTIDRIDARLVDRPKLYVADIKGIANFAWEAGGTYPHHNLYVVTSEEWDLRALRAVLMSGIARFFVSTYSVRMRGGFLRYQAQYLRRIRIPRWGDLSPAVRKALTMAGTSGDFAGGREAVRKAYGLNEADMRILEVDT